MKPIPWILMLMESHEQKEPSKNGAEYLKGCPVCEHNDPQLERELHAMAQLFFDIWLSRQKGNEDRDREAGIDNKT